MYNACFEEWKSLAEFPNYEVSNFGRVRNIKTHKEIKGSLNQGYIKVKFQNNEVIKVFSIHRLVALLFIPNPLNLPEVDHINTVRSDNRVENLRWVTKKENANNPISIKHKSESHKDRHWKWSEKATRHWKWSEEAKENFHPVRDHAWRLNHSNRMKGRHRVYNEDGSYTLE